MAEQNQQNKKEEQDLNQLLKVRREKLAELQENGKDPFQITKFDVTAHSTDVKDNFETMDGDSCGTNDVQTCDGQSVFL